MSQSAQSTVPAADDGERLYELERVAVPTPGEIRLLHRIGAGRAHRRLTAYVDEYTRAMAADAATKRSVARDEEHLEQIQEDYYDRIASPHDASEAAWAEHRRLLERASSSGLVEAAKAHNAAPTWLGLGALQRAAETRGALQRESETKIRPRARVHGTRPRPRQHRATATRRRRLSRSSSRSADPGDDGDGEPARRPPTRRGELRHISHALAAALEGLRPDEEVG